MRQQVNKSTSQQVNKITRRFLMAFAVVMISLSIKAQEPQVIDRVVAVVGQNIILQSAIEAQYRQYRL